MLKRLKKWFSPKPINFYHALGETSGISELVDHFYHFMETMPEAKDCLDVHELENGVVPDAVKNKLKDFLSGWLGGPNLFVEKYGHPRMRMRHAHIKIQKHHAEQWLLCMNHALKTHSTKMKNKHKIQLANSFAALAARIINS